MIVADPTDLEELFGSDRETHLYGLADLEEPFWSASTWHRDGDAAVGAVSTGEAWVTGYAMSRVAVDETLAMLADVHPSFPPGTWVTGPVGMHERLSTVRPNRPVGAHWRMILGEYTDVTVGPRAVELGADDLDALSDLYESDPGSSFFLPWMLEHSPFVGVWEGQALVAAAGCHVSSLRKGVAAVGAVITRPSHRGRGLGRSVVATLCRRLRGEYETIGLNTQADNLPALTLYESLGFRRVFQYEEIELLPPVL